MHPTNENIGEDPGTHMAATAKHETCHLANLVIDWAMVSLSVQYRRGG